MHNIDKLEKGIGFPIVNNQMRGHCFKYFKEITRHNHRENFFNRTADLGWNSLLKEVFQPPSANNFKTAIDCWMSSNQSLRLS